ncbi:hypothetical protein SGFS_073320 [Streptomyces graminofaciens]|uniref:Uncharacterized protein n=1 Tax=Streptomyces graminofaciens TaxID=68212 RepID=A0ABM7FI44_9ACTN|nr:hypothetical protein [Streptomyces graminofaciens]BBC36038.1 hypothetical protein SGFS_073320 [Streptomyces graminofaciens]
MPDLLWDDTKWFFDPAEMPSLPDVFVPDTTVEDGQSVLDLVEEQGWTFQDRSGAIPVRPPARTSTTNPASSSPSGVRGRDRRAIRHPLGRR